MKTSSKVMKLILPQNFQETVITHEMKFEKGDKTVNLIRNLLYLYSVGTEYYDSVNNMRLYEYYQEKSLKLLTCDEVISILDKDKNQNKYLKSNQKIQLFCDDLLKICEKEENCNLVYSNTEVNSYSKCDGLLFDANVKTNATSDITAESTPRSDNSPKKHYSKKSSSNTMYSSEPCNNNNLFVKEFEIDKINIINQFKSRITKVENTLNNDLSSQSEKFKKIKMQKMLNQNQKSIRKALIIDPKQKSFIKRSESTLSACSMCYYKSIVNTNSEETMMILNNLMNLSEKKILCVQNKMQLEMETFINANLEEMYKNLDELKLTFEKEIKIMEGTLPRFKIENGLTVVVKSLEEDMKNEIENLKDQYEELRRIGIEKINLKYKTSFK